jgi:hypothetical protein
MLAFSQRLVTRVVFDQKIEIWLRVHIEAFAELGGADEDRARQPEDRGDPRSVRRGRRGELASQLP